MFNEFWNFKSYNKAKQHKYIHFSIFLKLKDFFYLNDK